MNPAQQIGFNLVVFNFALVVVCVVISLISLALNEQGAWYWKSFKQFVNSRKTSQRASLSRGLVEEKIDKLAENIAEAAVQSGRQLDRHMVWLSAGAIYFILQLMHNGGQMESAEMLTFSFVYFQFCILAVVTSYFLQHEATLRAKRAPAANLRLLDHIEENFPKTIKTIEKTKGYVQACDWWNYLRTQIILSRFFGFMLVIFNGLAYFAFVVGSISFTVFMIINK